MKNKNLLLLASVLLLASCGESNESITSKESETISESVKPQDSTKESETSKQSESTKESETSKQSESSKESEAPSKPESYKLEGKVTNLFKDNLANATITVGETTTSTDENGNFSITNLKGDETFTVTKDGYEPATYTLAGGEDATIKYDINLASEYVPVGYASETKEWTNFGNFTMYATRNATNLMVRFATSNKTWATSEIENQIELYISTGDTSSRGEGTYQIVYNPNNKNNISIKHYGEASVSNNITYSLSSTNSKDYIDLAIPFADLKSSNDAILGLSFGEWTFEGSGDWCAMAALLDSNTRSVETPTSYVRLDAYNITFTNKYNNYVEDNPVEKYDIDELTEDYPIHFALTDIASPNADNIYAKYTFGEDSLTFDMLGFGTFTDTESIKTVIHVGSENGEGTWGLNANDLSIFTNKTSATYMTGSTWYFDYEKMSDGTATTEITPTYEEKEEGYFTYSFSIPYSMINDFSLDKKISVLFMEFGNEIYNQTAAQGLYMDDIALGDGAFQSNYAIINTKAVDADVFEGYNIHFATTQDDIYAKIERDYTNEKLILNFKAYGSLDATKFIRFIVKDGSNLTSGVWALDNSDMSFTIYNDKAYYQTNVTGFWSNEHNTIPFAASVNDETMNTPEYNYDSETDLYTLKFEIEFSELGFNVTEETILRGILIEFVNNGQIVGGNCYYQDNTQGGDPAIQSNYLTF